MMTDYYNKFSDSYDELYYQHIIEFQKRSLKLNEEDQYFADFYPSFGITSSEKTDFLIYGQAVNGWSSGFGLYDKIDQKKTFESISASNMYLAEKNHTPLDWVNIQWSDSIYNQSFQDEVIRKFYFGRTEVKYLAYRSLFWNVTYKLISDYYNLSRGSFDWSKKLVWSNLYKIAPDGSNPNSTQQDLQQPFASELINREILELDPKFCIVFTNLEWWKPFRENIKTTILDYNKVLDEVVSVEGYNNTKIIVLNRPRFGNSEKFVNQILSIIKG